MSVVKRKRKESPFEVFHHLTKMRQNITDLLLRDFGYSNEKFQKKIERRYGGKKFEELTDVQKKDYERQKERNVAFDEWYIAKERETVMECIHFNPKRLTVMRRKMKKLSGCLTEKEFSNLYHSWFNSYSRYMSKKQRENMDILYEDIKTKHYKRRRTC